MRSAAGRLLVEVFEDRIPLAARQLLNRCRPGSHGCFQGTTVARLMPEQGFFVRSSRCAQPPGKQPCLQAYRAAWSGACSAIPQRCVRPARQPAVSEDATTPSLSQREQASPS